MKKVFLFFAIALLLPLSGCVETEEIAADTIIEKGIYQPFEESDLVECASRIDNTFLVAGGSKLGILNYEIMPDGTLSFSETKMLDYSGEDIISVCTGLDGYFYVLADKIFKYSAEGELLDSISYEGEPTGIAVDFDGSIVLYGRFLDILGVGSISEQVSDGGVRVFSVSPTSKGLIVSMSLLGEGRSIADTFYYLLDTTDASLMLVEAEIVPTEEMKVNGIIHSIGGGNPFLSQGIDGEYITGSFSVADFDTGIAEELLDISDFFEKEELSIAFGLAGNACRIADKTFVFTVKNGRGLYVAYETVPAADELSVVNIAVFGDSTINSYIDGEYYYKFKHYSYEQRDLLLTEISTARNAPDLVLFLNPLTSAMWDLDALTFNTPSDHFMDLYSFIDADPELSRESFLPNLLDSIEVDGELSQLWSSVWIMTMLERQEEGDYPYAFEYHFGREALLDNTTSIAVSLWIDRDNGTASFDTGEFEEFLKWVKESGSDYNVYTETAVSFPYGISEAKYKPAIIQKYNHLRDIGLQFGVPFKAVGYPVGGLSGTYYVSADESYCFAIPKSGSNSEGAWEFIKARLYEEPRWGMSVMIDSFTSKASETLKDEPLRQMIFTCGKAYFDGAKSLEETVAEIQSRASVYMAEKYG